MRVRVVWLLAIVLAIAIAVVVMLYVRDIRRAYARISGRSTVVSSPYGDIEYGQGGVGPAVLVIHGGGGGFDQGELIAQLVLQDNFQWIAPSRFGYLRSSFHPGATWDDQAHAYAYLLDQLGIRRVAVIGFSQGGPSALLFAALYPERVSSLTCISCGVAPSTATSQDAANQKGKGLVMAFKYDFPLWTFTRFFKNQFMGLMGASDDVIAALTPRQREWVGMTIDTMNPASVRSAGALFDNVSELPGPRIAAIRAPTLIIHAADDLLQLYHNAEFAAATIPGARLMRFEHGGHLLVAVELEAIQPTVRQHLLEHQ
jgi:2-hydroxy-6-oxonona-2,4-dienedioate hydrolase